MNITINARGASRAAVLDSPERLITDVQSALDLIATLNHYHDCQKLVLYKHNLAPEFFDLSTTFAGGVLQKFINYRAKLAIVGDFSAVTSKSLRDFIYESNNGRDIFFQSTVEAALDKLHGAG